MFLMLGAFLEAGRLLLQYPSQYLVITSALIIRFTG